MLAYAFQVLKEDSYSNVETEEFENACDLLAAILGKGISNQVRRGLGREYISKSEMLSSPAGKIDISFSLKQQSMMGKKLVCEFDEFTENIYMNKVLKTTALILLRASDVSTNQKKALKRVLLFFGNVDELDPHFIIWSSIKYHRNNATYKMLLNICYLVIEGMLQTEQNGSKKLSKYIDDQRMYSLYERFVLEYFRKHYPQLSVSASHISWDVDDGVIDLLPEMKSDITIEYGGKTLIIDTKYYGHTMQTNTLYNNRTLHSANLYQIFTYVKNRDTGNSGNVSGVLLYAKTDEEITPDNNYIMSGNRISVKTLDLNTDFSNIELQLNSLIENYFGDALKKQRFINDMKKYLHYFETQSGPYYILEGEMQNTMMDLGFVDLWNGNIEKYKINNIQIDNPESYKPAIETADLVMLKVLISYSHRQVTHWSETSLFEYRDFFICLLKKLLIMAHDKKI
jgi:5-methylcytosine-specific restriction enzyme subunit McrC